MLSIKDGKFEINGEKISIYSGAIHYFRVPHQYWRDRLKKLKAAGFNTVETYVCWNLHEPKKGEYDFSGMLDLAQYLQVAKEEGLYAIVRPGPYICAEWDFGGFPAWLLADENIRLRCMSEPYLTHVADFYKELLKRIDHMQITKGGNVIAMQVENEYGSYANDKKYLNFIKNLMLDCGVEVMLFTSDGNWCNMLSGGSLPELYKVLNFGSGAKGAFRALKGFQENAPKMCGEFWCGWFDHWGERHHTRNSLSVVKEINDFLDQDASFNFYMFHGGTNFNFWAGANHGKKYEPTTTSYDYCALINEYGGYTPAYHAVREVMHKHQNLPLGELPSEPKTQSIGEVKLTKAADLMKNIPNISTKHISASCESMEKFGQNFGMILYHTEVKGKYMMSKLNFEGVHDIAYVYINGALKYVFDRAKGKKALFGKVKPCDSFSFLIGGFDGTITIDVLVEGMGRVNYGKEIYDRKGLKQVSLGNQIIFDWEVYTIPLDDLSKLAYTEPDGNYPGFLKGEFETTSDADCFIDMSGFTKGCVYVNGINLGRYWKIGPQKTLYLPGVYLKKGKNEIVVLEQEGCVNPLVKIVDKPNLG